MCVYSLPFWGAPIVIEAAQPEHPPMALLCTLLFLFGCAAQLGASASYHCHKWQSRRTERIAHQLDYVGIYCLISGIFSPVYGMLIPEPTNHRALLVQWGAAVVGSAVSAVPCKSGWLRLIPFLLASHAGLLVSWGEWRPREDKGSGGGGGGGGTVVRRFTALENRSFACMVLLYSVGAVLLEQAWEARMYNTVHGDRGSTQKRQRRR